MKNRLVGFKSKNDSVVLVNPDNVTHVTTQPNHPQSSVIYFVGGGSMYVDHTLDVVQAALQG